MCGHAVVVGITVDISDDLLRLAEAHASLSGISLRQFVTDTLRDSSPVSVPTLMRELGNSPRGAPEGGP